MVGETDQLLARRITGETTIQRVLDAAGLTDCEHVIDYGGGRGVWVWNARRATVYDPIAAELAPGRDQAEHEGRPIHFTDRLDNIDQADGMLLIAAQQYMTDEQLHDFFTFAAEHLVPGGRLLATVASPLLAVQFMTSRVRYDGPRAIPLWGAHATLGAVRRVGWPPGRGYCLRRREFVRIAEQHDLRYVADLGVGVDRDYWRMVGDPRRWRGYHWVVLERE